MTQEGMDRGGGGGGGGGLPARTKLAGGVDGGGVGAGEKNAFMDIA